MARGDLEGVLGDELAFDVPSLPDPIHAIVVPLDGSRFAERAVAAASDLALRLGAAVHLLTAVPENAHVVDWQAAVADIAVDLPAVHREIVVDPDPARAVHEALRRLQPAVACMASHGRGRSAALIGSVANEVVARCRDPLILIGQLVDDTFPGWGIVACVDETPPSWAILPVALRWAQLLHEPLTVITVAEPAPESPGGSVKRAFGPDGDVEAFLEVVVAPLRARGHEVRTVPVYDPVSPAAGICTYAEAHPASLVGLCSRGRTGVARLAFGSVAASVVHRCPSPVLVARRPHTS